MLLFSIILFYSIKEKRDHANTYKQQIIMKKALLTYISTTIFACSHYPTNIEKTLSFAGSNRNELEKVLRHYAGNPEDSLKYKAACFLIDNMKWHLSTDQVSFPDSSIFEWHSRINNLYDNVTDNIADTSLYKPNINELLWNFTLSARYLYSAIPSDTPYVQKGIFPDPKNVTADFLVSHIDNAFQVWQSSSYASYLSFDEFKELILPYRAVTGYSFYENGKKLNDMFGKWLDRCTDKNLDNYITRYQHYAGFIQMILGVTPQKQHVGIYDLFLGYKGDCITVADNACKVFRAYGIPVAVDCNISYRERAGRHFHCTLFDTTGNRVYYNATGNYDTLSLLDFASPSIIRNTFGAQNDSPYKLKATDEYLPKYFDTPCIKDVTSEYYPVTQIALPFNMETSNRLAYLYSYSNQPDGIAPTTWGEINRENKQVVFKNAVYYVLYFPMCFQGDNACPVRSTILYYTDRLVVGVVSSGANHLAPPQSKRYSSPPPEIPGKGVFTRAGTENGWGTIRGGQPKGLFRCSIALHDSRNARVEYTRIYPGRVSAIPLLSLRGLR